MTYLENITYLTGNYLQISQFVLKNAFRVISLTEGKEKETHYLAGSAAMVESLEAMAASYQKENASLSGKELIEYFSGRHGLSTKDFNALKKMLTRRDYLVASFYIENSAAFGREEIAIYESKVNELREWVEDANKLNVALSKACDRLYDLF